MRKIEIYRFNYLLFLTVHILLGCYSSVSISLNTFEFSPRPFQSSTSTCCNPLLDIGRHMSYFARFSSACHIQFCLSKIVSTSDLRGRTLRLWSRSQHSRARFFRQLSVLRQIAYLLLAISMSLFLLRHYDFYLQRNSKHNTFHR